MQVCPDAISCNAEAMRGVGHAAYRPPRLRSAGEVQFSKAGIGCQGLARRRSDAVYDVEHARRQSSLKADSPDFGRG